jgi:NAD(P)-dependent dehydrogenase (short-subunit alcohol dehydrogenase family)
VKRFGGKNAIVTGASRGIGAAVAERLAAEGAKLIITARTLDHHPRLAGSLNETAERCRHHGAMVETIAADLADPESRAAIVPAALDRFDGQLDILVNNAGAAIYASMLDYPLRRARLSFEINFFAPLELSQAAIAAMSQTGGGWIVNVSSATARHSPGPPFRTSGVTAKIGIYGSTKAALNRMTNAFAVELDGTAIRVNTIEPRAAVLSEGAQALVGDIVGPAQIESMEAMVEATVALCACGTERTGKVHVSLDLLDELDLTVMNLDGVSPFPGGRPAPLN